MRRPLTDRDTGDETTLFNLDETAPRRCESCGTTRKNLCAWEADRDKDHSASLEASLLLGKRPRTCLQRPNPATDPFPEGF